MNYKYKPMIYFLKRFSILKLLLILSCENKKQVEEFTDRFEEKAGEALTYCKANNLNTNYAILIDFALPCGKNRLVLWDFKNNKKEIFALCTHGSCGAMGVPYTDKEAVFSNLPESHCSSEGKMKIGERSYSKWGINIHYKLRGLEPQNSNVYKRVIVLHSWEAVPDQEIYPRTLAKSWGCPAVSNNVMRRLDKILQKEKTPMLMWIFK